MEEIHGRNKLKDGGKKRKTSSKQNRHAETNKWKVTVGPPD